MHSFATITTILLNVFWIAKLWLGSFLEASIFFISLFAFKLLLVQLSVSTVSHYLFSTRTTFHKCLFLFIFYSLCFHGFDRRSDKKSGYNYFFQRIMLLVWENTDFFVLIWTKTSVSLKTGETAVLSISCLVRCLCCCF